MDVTNLSVMPIGYSEHFLDDVFQISHLIEICKLYASASDNFLYLFSYLLLNILNIRTW